MGKLLDRIVHAWNAFTGQNPSERIMSYGAGVVTSTPPFQSRLRYTNEKSIIAAIYTRMAIDASTVDLGHVRTDKEGRYLEHMSSLLQECLSVEANIDQAARAFKIDCFMTLFDRGYLAIVPVDTTMDPNVTGGFDVKSMRVGYITAWMPEHVRVSVYNEKKGFREEIPLAKRFVGIVYNPLYAVMNETNSTLQRLVRKLNLLDLADEQASSGRLDIIIQLPYLIRSESKRSQAAQRRTDLENQLRGSQYGVAYTDATEKIVQLNRPAENNLLKQIELLTDMLYAQLGLTPEVMNGTADEAAMLHYFNRTIEPLVTAVVEAMRRSFLTKTARAQGQDIKPFRDAFKLVPLAQIAEIADVFSRNEIATANELRQAIGWKPHKDPKADQLVNSNMPEKDPAPTSEPQNPSTKKLGGDSQNGS